MRGWRNFLARGNLIKLMNNDEILYLSLAASVINFGGSKVEKNNIWIWINLIIILLARKVLNLNFENYEVSILNFVDHSRFSRIPSNVYE